MSQSPTATTRLSRASAITLYAGVRRDDKLRPTVAALKNQLEEGMEKHLEAPILKPNASFILPVLRFIIMSYEP
jgi:hypothetical protein